MTVHESANLKMILSELPNVEPFFFVRLLAIWLQQLSNLTVCKLYTRIQNSSQMTKFKNRNSVQNHFVYIGISYAHLDYVNNMRTYLKENNPLKL